MTDLFGNSDSDEESFVATKRRRTLEEPTPTHQSTVGGSAVLEQSTSTDPTTRPGVRTEQQTADIQQVCRGFRSLNKEIRILNNSKTPLEEGSSCDIHIYDILFYFEETLFIMFMQKQHFVQKHVL